MKLRLLYCVLVVSSAFADVNAGVFGRWEGQTYVWDPKKLKNPWNSTESSFPLYLNRTDHFIVGGNDQFNVVHFTDGRSTFVTFDRSTMMANVCDVEGLCSGTDNLVSSPNSSAPGDNFGGPIGYVVMGEEALGTSPGTLGSRGSVLSLNWTADGEMVYETRQIFLESNGSATIRRSTMPPAGNVSSLVSRVVVESSAQLFSWFEAWDVNLRQMETQLLRTGLFAPIGDALRDGLNAAFVQNSRDVEFSFGEQSTARGLVISTTLNPYLSFPSPYNRSCWLHTLKNETDAIVRAKMCGLPPKNTSSAVDYYPPDVFLVVINNSAVSTASDQAQVFRNSSSVCGEKYVCPKVSNFVGAKLPVNSAGYGQRAMTGLYIHNVSSGTELTFVYGVVQQNESIEAVVARSFGGIRSVVDGIVFEHESSLKGISSPTPGPFWPNASFPTASDVISREMQWRSKRLVSWMTKRSTMAGGVSVIPQGSAYEYLHGLDGAARDWALVVAGLVRVSPTHALETLKAMFGMRDARSGQIWYGIGGVAEPTGAVIHSHPSDLDIAVLWGLVEYVSVTGHSGVLFDVEVPFFDSNAGQWTCEVLPPGARGCTVLDHVYAAVSHLEIEVGWTDDGIFRMLDGDWDDGVLLQAADEGGVEGLLNSRLYGGSIPNSQMAATTFPRVAQLVNDSAPSLAATLLSISSQAASAVQKCFGTKWFARAVFLNANNISYFRGNDGSPSVLPPFEPESNQTFLSLQSQIWPLLDAATRMTNPAYPSFAQRPVSPISMFPSSANPQDLFAEILSNLQTPIGIANQVNQEVWPAIAQFFTSSFATASLSSPPTTTANPYGVFLTHTLAQHASVFPHIWSGIWGAPDGTDSQSGLAWASAATPMLDFPTSNTNPPSLAAFAFPHLAGITWEVGTPSCSSFGPSNASLRIDLRSPFAQQGPTSLQLGQWNITLKSTDATVSISQTIPLPFSTPSLVCLTITNGTSSTTKLLKF